MSGPGHGVELAEGVVALSGGSLSQCRVLLVERLEIGVFLQTKAERLPANRERLVLTSNHCRDGYQEHEPYEPRLLRELFHRVLSLPVGHQSAALAYRLTRPRRARRA